MAGTGKADDAFRTIGEVSDWLETPAHVLRFWESKFTQIKPVKRAGGRRYYRPEDITLLGGIKFLLHEEGMTIKGVQKLLREQGVRDVAALSPKGAPGDPPPIAEVAEALPAETPQAEPPAPTQPALLAALIHAEPAHIHRQRKQITPLLTRLQAMQDRLADG